MSPTAPTNPSGEGSPAYEGKYCGIGAWLDTCPYQKDHPTKKRREYCTRYKRTLVTGQELMALRCAPCRKENP